MTNQVSFGKQSGTFGNIIGSVGSSALNVGVTVGAGAGVGACIGKLASLTPYKPSAAALEHQYIDILEKAAMQKKTPEYIKNAGEEVFNAFKVAKRAIRRNWNYESKFRKAQQIEELVERLTSPKADLTSTLKGYTANLQNIAKGILKIDKDASVTSEELINKLVEKHEKLIETLEKRKPADTKSLTNAFIEKASQNNDIKELAETGAKHLRKTSIVGIGMAIGIVGALVINLLNTNGVIKLGKRTQNKQQNTGMPAVNVPLEKTTQG